MVKKILLILFLLVATIGFSQEKSISKLVTSPNPFENYTTISFNSEKKQDILIVVKNVLGRTVFNKRFNVKNGKNSIPFERGNLKDGMYIYVIQTQKETHTKRFVIR